MSLSRNELLLHLSELKTDDIEMGHVNADALLLDYIDDADITEAFYRIPKWYA